MARTRQRSKPDIERLDNARDKTVRDVDRTKGYLSKMVLRAPKDGIVNLLPNFRAQGSFGSSPPPSKKATGPGPGLRSLKFRICRRCEST